MLGAALAAALVLAGCSSSDGSGSSTSTAGGSGMGLAAPEPAARAAAGAADAAAQGAKSDGSTQQTASSVLPSRAVVRTAAVTVQVRDVLAGSARASSLATAAGGFVGGEQTLAAPDDPAKAQAVLTLRVPSDRLAALLPQLRALGTLVSEQQTADDVTGQVIDVQARIDAQKASVARVTALMARATTLGQVVQIEGELTARQAALESLQGQAAALADQTALASVTLTLVGPSAPAAVPPTGFGAGVSKGWDAFVAAGTWVLTAVGALLPFALLLAPLAFAVAVLRRRRRTDVGPVPTEPPAAAAG